MRRLLLSVVMIGVCCGMATAQCNNGRCPAPALDAYRWVPVQGRLGEFALFQGQRQLGNWMPRQRQFWELKGESYIMRHVEPPIPPPVSRDDADVGAVGALPADFREDGVRQQKLSLKDRHTISGRQVTVTEAESALSKPSKSPGPADESEKNWLVIAGGTQDERNEVQRQLQNAPELASLLARTRIWSGAGADNEHWIMRDRSTGKPLYPPGSPRIMLCQANGVTLHSQDSFDGQPAIDALRRADPLRDPKKDPDLRLPIFPNFGAKHWSLPGVLMIGLVVVLVLAVLTQALKGKS